MKNFITIFFLVLLFCASCDQINTNTTKNEDASKVARTYYEDGKLKSETPVNDDKKRHGLSKQYYRSGGLKAEIHYNEGKRERAVQYYENGNMQMDFPYQDGKKHGKRSKYWENGNLQSVVEYANGEIKAGLIEYKRDGEQVTKYPTLKIKRIDLLESSGEYHIEVYFSSNANRGTYYVGSLEDGSFGSDVAKLKKVNGRGRLTFKPMPGTFMMEKLNFIGSYKTVYGNTLIVEDGISLAIDY